ncbi:unnamed protein product [Clonostachys rosea f. rosea IK726]|uniref:Uncharacterized protein n=2 Tax=Bionectria ochroleuca TaxID=29856 RepID=A0A0B7K9B9_BIOOC|nr:unnamed protein product [Clonostachys rosea f. rosea IK726]
MSIPLKVKVAIRDIWDKPDSPVQEAITRLKNILGLDFICEPAWPLLTTELSSHYDDNSELAKSVINFVKVWVEAMTELLDDEENSEWADSIVDLVKDNGAALKLHLEVKAGDASTAWSDSQRSFLLHLPSSNVTRPDQYTPTFKTQLLSCFKKDKPLALRPSAAGDLDPEDEEDYEAPKPVSETLPDPRSLPKPSTLLQAPPYHLFVHAFGNNTLEVQCSNGPTLDFLAEYFKKWAQPSSGQAVPVKVENNHQSSSFGMSYDTITLSTEPRYGRTTTLSPPVILALIEGLLGYELVYRDASHWQYRRETPIRR